MQVNPNAMSLTLTAADGKSYKYNFQPGQIWIDDTAASYATVKGFLIDGKSYFYHPANTAALITAKAIKIAVDAVSGRIGFRWGIAGGIAGIAAGSTIGQLAERFIDYYPHEGYFREDGSLVFKGKKEVDIA